LVKAARLNGKTRRKKVSATACYDSYHLYNWVQVRMRVRIEYADQNDSFAKVLPRSGVVVSTLRETTTGRPWKLVRLDEPFEWQHKVAEFFQFSLLSIDHLLVAPRWVGVDIGGPEPAPVFICLVERGCPPTGENLDIKKYARIAWGMCHTERN
jgi:hypothetical protein